MTLLDAKSVDHVLGMIDRFVRFMIVLCVGGMLTVVASQVFARYVMNSSFGWADEISRLFFVWAIFLGIPIGIRARAHIGITMLTSRLPLHRQERLQTGTSAIGACLMALVAWEALVISVQQWDELMISVDISNAWFTMALAVGGVHASLHLMRITVFGQYPA